MASDKSRGLLYALLMISIMVVIGVHYSVQSAPQAVAQPSSSSSAPQSAQSGSILNSVSSVSSEIAVPTVNPHFSQTVSSESVSETKKANSQPVPASSGTLTPKQAIRQYYDVPLSNDLQDYLFDECASKKVPADLVLALINVESDFNPNMISKTDDYGLMQINICHKDFLRKTLKVTDLLDEKQNIKAGVYMLSGIVDKYSNLNQALMVYNRGEAGAKKLWNNGVYSTNYSRNVIAKIDEIKRLA